MIKHIATVYLAGHWLPALVNADYSGLERGEDVLLDSWTLAYPCATYEISDESEFARDDVTGLMADCYEVNIWR